MFNTGVFCLYTCLENALFKCRFALAFHHHVTASKTALRPTQPPIQWVPGALSMGVKWPGRESDHSPPSSAKVKGCVQLYLHSPDTPSWRRAQLKRRDNLTLHLSYLTITSIVILFQNFFFSFFLANFLSHFLFLFLHFLP
jgi:hypothetical protein